MEIKRQYDDKDLQRYKAEQEVALQDAKAQVAALNLPDDLVEDFAKRLVERKNIQQPKISALLLMHTGIMAEQNFSTDFVTEYLQLGLMKLSGNALTLHVVHDDYDVELAYQVKRAPGRYCLHCGEKLESDETGELARLHIALQHAGVESPDASVPAGYVWLKHFECVLDALQHEMFKKAG